jgi:hypothetical protein
VRINTLWQNSEILYVTTYGACSYHMDLNVNEALSSSSGIASSYCVTKANKLEVFEREWS